jgi:protein-disulfide isomerase
MRQMLKNVLQKIAPILFLLIIVMAFGLGALWQRVSFLEKEEENNKVAGEETSPTASPLNQQALEGYAQQIGLNVEEFKACLENQELQEAVTKELEQGQNLGVNGTPYFFLNGHAISGALPFDLFESAIEFELKSGDWNNPDDSVQTLVDGDPRNGEVEKLAVEVEIGDAPQKGSSDAPITLVEFSDFECPYCTRFFLQAYPQILSQYVEQGKVLLVYKQFPLISIHAYAQESAVASLCAQKQGKFWEYHDQLFEAMKEISL